jgi:hypothetical protein
MHAELLTWPPVLSVNTLLEMLTVSAGAYMHTALPLEAPTFPANVQLSTVDAAASATAPPSMAVLLTKVQPLSAAAAAAYTAPPIAFIVYSGGFRKLHEKAGMASKVQAACVSTSSLCADCSSCRFAAVSQV